MNLAAGWVGVGGKTQFFGADEPVEILSLDGSGPLHTLPDRSGRVAVSTGGRWLVTGEVDGKCKVYDTANWSLHRELEAPGQIVSLAFSPDERWIAGALRLGGVALWELATGRLVFRGEGHARQVVWCLAFSPDGRWLASGGSDQTVHLWNLASQRLERVLRGHEDEVWGVVFGPDGRWLATSGKDETVRVWPLDVDSGTVSIDMLAGRPIYSSDGRWLACAQRGGGPLLILESATMAVAGRLPAEEVSLAFAGDGRVLITSPRGRKLTRWDWQNAKPAGVVTLEDAGGAGDRLALSPDGRWLAMALANGRLAVWSAESGALVFQSATDEPMAHELAFSPDNQWLATSHNDFNIRLRPVGTWASAVSIQHHKMRTAGLSFFPDSSNLATASWDGTAAIFSIPAGRPLTTFRGHTTSLQDVVCLPGGKLLALLESDGSVAFWDLRSRRSSARLSTPIEESNHNLAIRPDGRMIFTTRLGGSRPGIWRGTVEKMGVSR